MILLTDEERRQIPKGFHYLLEYKEELDWVLRAQLKKLVGLLKEDTINGDFAISGEMWVAMEKEIK